MIDNTQKRFCSFMHHVSFDDIKIKIIIEKTTGSENEYR